MYKGMFGVLWAFIFEPNWSRRSLLRLKWRTVQHQAAPVFCRLSRGRRIWPWGKLPDILRGGTWEACGGDKISPDRNWKNVSAQSLVKNFIKMFTLYQTSKTRRDQGQLRRVDNSRRNWWKKRWPIYVARLSNFIFNKELSKPFIHFTKQKMMYKCVWLCVCSVVVSSGIKKAKHMALYGSKSKLGQFN